MTWWMLPSLIGTLLSLISARQASLLMRPPAGTYMTALSLMIAWWCIGQWSSLLWQDLGYRLLISKLQYVAIATVPVLWFSLALTYSGFGRFLQRWYALFWLPPIVTIFLAFTNEFHHLIWARFELGSQPRSLLIEYGLWFNAYVSFAYSAVTLGTLILAYRVSFNQGHRLQFLAIIVSPIVVIGVNIPFILGFNPLPIDPTPAGFAVACIILLAGLRHQMFSVLPVARRHTLDRLSDGVVVIDDHGLIADRNPAAKRIFGAEQVRVGYNFYQALPENSTLNCDQSTEIHMDDGRWLDIRISPLQAIDGSVKGQVALIRDISQQKQLQATLLKTQHDLQALNAKLESLASTDELTGLANRRSLYERLREEWSRSTRHGTPLSIILIDFDNFKRVNDTHGHQVGDQVLKCSADAIKHIMRPEDLAARHGGEELAVLLSDTDQNVAYDIAERIRQTLQALKHRDQKGQAFTVTISAGVAARLSEDSSADNMIARADKALYLSKASGRNKVTLADTVND